MSRSNWFTVEPILVSVVENPLPRAEPSSSEGFDTAVEVRIHTTRDKGYGIAAWLPFGVCFAEGGQEIVYRELLVQFHGDGSMHICAAVGADATRFVPFYPDGVDAHGDPTVDIDTGLMLPYCLEQEGCPVKCGLPIMEMKQL